MDTLRTSVKPKPYDSQKQEKLPTLSEHGSPDVVVKIDGNSQNPFETTSAAASSPSSRVWREGSYDFSQVGGVGNGRFTFDSSPTEDPPSRLINSFLRKREATGVTMSPAVDLEMDFLNKSTSLGFESNEHCMSFQDALEHSLPLASHDSSSSSCDEKKMNRHGAGSDGEVIRCTSSSSISRSSSLLQSRTRSRLLDPSPLHIPSPVKNHDPDKRSGWPPVPRSGQLKSEATGGKSGPADEDDDDLLIDSDIPAELRKTKFDTWTVLQSLSLILIIAALVCSLVIPRLTRQTVCSLHLWKWDVLVLTLICGRLVSGWFVRVAVFLIERNFLLRKRVLYFVYGVKSAVQNCLWLVLVLISWHYLFDSKTAHSPVLPYVSKILLCLLVATILRLIKTLLLKVLAACFHVSTYFDRIQEALFNQYVVETLSGPPVYEDDQTMVEVQRLQKAGAKMPRDLQATALLPARNSGQIGKGIRLSRAMSGNKIEEGITIDQLHKLNQRNISAWNMKRLIRIVRYGALTTLDDRIPLIAAETGDESSTHILSEHEAKIAARKIFTNVAKPGAKYIYFQDLLHFMKLEDATKTMNLFEGVHEHKGISKGALKNWAVNAFRERKALALTLNDTKTAVNKLHQIANLVVGVIVFALWLLILGIATTHFFVFLSSQLLLAVFIFGNTLKTLFEALIFLFVMHPFDVGDRCEIEDVQVVVEEMNIMSTIFLRYDNLKIHYPNSVLATKPICNFYRSPDMGDSIDFAIHVATPLEKIAKMKERIIQFMENKKEHWYPRPMVVLRDVEDNNKLTVSIWMQQRINYQDMGMRFERRELVVQEMIRVLRELDIEYRNIPVDVNVRNLPPVSSARLPSTWSSVN